MRFLNQFPDVCQEVSRRGAVDQAMVESQTEGHALAQRDFAVINRGRWLNAPYTQRHHLR